MEHHIVDSSVLHSVGYSDQTAVLEIQIQNGRIYRYYNVERDIYLELLEAPSFGRYFNDEIRDAYPYERVK